MPYSAPTLSGSVPNPVTQPLQGVLNWTESLLPGADSAALLLHFDGPNGSTTLVDTSGTNNTVTANGTAVIDTSAPEFGTGALKLAANTDYVSVPCTAGGPLDLSSAAVDFTVEFWYKPADHTLTVELFEIGEGTAFASGGFQIYTTGGNSVFMEGFAISGIALTGNQNVTMANGVWKHMGVCRQGGQAYIFADGSVTACTANLNSLKWPAGTNNLRIGKGNWAHCDPGAEVDELRVTVGTALYTSAYTVPSAPFPDGGGIPAPSLLVHGDSALVDNSIYNNTLTSLNGGTSPAIDASVHEFGAGSITNQAFGTCALYASVTPGGVLDITAGDFTLECWIYFKDTTNAAPPLFNFYTGTITALTLQAQMYVGVSGTFGNAIIRFSDNTFITLINASTPIVIHTWYHVAIVRQGSNFDYFVNGQSHTSTVGGSSSAKNLHSYVTINVIGSEDPSHPNTNNNGQYNIDEFRLLKGYCAYTPGVAFTPPSAPFPAGPQGGGGTPATGYDIYRGGVSIATVGNVLTYTDNVPTYGTYTYNVAAYVGGVDVSPLSNSVNLTYAGAVAGFPNCVFDEAIYGGYFGGQLNLVEFTYMPGRTPFEEGATNLIINRYKQEPTDSRQRGVDFTQFAVPGETLQTVVVSGISAQGVPQAQTSPLVTPLVITNVVIDPVTGLKFGYTVSGGQNGIEYTVQFTTTTSIQSQTLEEIFSINIMIEDMFP